MKPAAPTTPQRLRADLDQLWSSLDSLMEGIQVREADVGLPRLACGLPASIPAHVARFDHGIVLHAVGRRSAVPPHDQRTVMSTADLERWSAPAPSIHRRDWQATRAWMLAGRAAIQQILDDAAENDTELDEPIWWPLPLNGGWQTTRLALEACNSHTWNHVVQLWAMFHGSSEPMPESLAPSTHRALSRYACHVSRLLDPRRLARTSPLTAVMVFTGPGGGAWTFRIRNGDCQVTEQYAGDADVVITQSPATFARTFLFGTESQLRAVLAGDIRVDGSMRSVLSFRRLFLLPPAGARIPQG